MPSKPTPPTVAQAVEIFLQYLTTVPVSKATVDYYRTQLHHLVANCGKIRVDRLQPLHLLGVPKLTWHKVQSAQRFSRWLVRILRVGIVDPFAEIQKPPAGRRSRTLTRHEFAKLVQNCPRWLRLFLLLQRRLACRPGELRQMRWDQLHFPERLYVLHQFKAKDRRRDGAACRLIPLDAWVLRMLARLRTRGGRYVLLTAQGKPISKDTLARAVARAAARAELDGVCAYVVRHTSATDLTAAGIPQKILADFLGHTSTRTTERYQHLEIDHVRVAVEEAVKKGQDRRRGH